MHPFLKFILAWNSTYFGEFVCPSTGVYSLYTQQWYMTYRFVDSFRAGSGWKKKDKLYEQKKINWKAFCGKWNRDCPASLRSAINALLPNKINIARTRLMHLPFMAFQPEISLHCRIWKLEKIKGKKLTWLYIHIWQLNLRKKVLKKYKSIILVPILYHEVTSFRTNKSYGCIFQEILPYVLWIILY